VAPCAPLPKSIGYCVLEKSDLDQIGVQASVSELVPFIAFVGMGKKSSPFKFAQKQSQAAAR
jgi:hypothetical protein